VTLYHWDLPQKLQDRGGWANREIAGWFADYARALYTGLGDLVDYWITLNEPFCVAFRSYWDGAHAPGYRDYSMALSAVHHQLMAHGAAVKAYRQTGLTAPIGITLNMNSMYPLDPANPADAAAANRLHLQSNRLFGDPVMKGSYPQELFDFLQTRGVVLPDIQPGDLELISQELDFFGLNNYYAEYVKADPAVWPLGCRAAKTGKPQTDAGWEVTPDGLYDLLVWIQEAYAPKQIIITENGAASNDFVNLDGKVADPVRQDYLRRYLIAVKQAIDSGVPVTGYYVWCFCDNFEWAWGLSRRFGIVYVDYKTQQRIPKESALWYARVIRDGGFD
jgi:beta-glucosidase